MIENQHEMSITKLDRTLTHATERWVDSGNRNKENCRREIDKLLEKRSELMKLRDKAICEP